jgi:hypothetical protein
MKTSIGAENMVKTAEFHVMMRSINGMLQSGFLCGTGPSLDTAYE